LQPMPRDPALLQRSGERRSVVVELDAEDADARVGTPRLVTGRRQRDEGVVLAHGDELRLRRDAADERPRALVRFEGEDRFDFGVAWEGLRARGEDRAAVAVERVVALPRVAQTLGDAMLIAEEEV